MEFQKLNVGIILENQNDVIDLLFRLTEGNVFEKISISQIHGSVFAETQTMCFIWIKPYTYACGNRFHVVYTTQEIERSDWYKTVIKPMLCLDRSIIDYPIEFDNKEKLMTVKEYNKEFCQAYSRALSFLNCLDNALQKSDENARMQCAVIGWDEETKDFLIKALQLYQEETKRSVMAQIDKN